MASSFLFSCGDVMQANTASFPIILIPEKLMQILESSPNLPPKPLLPAEPVLPPEPQKPKKPEEPQKPQITQPEKIRGRFSKTGWVGAAGITALAILEGPLGFAALGSLAAYAAFDSTVGYKKRLEQYKKDMLLYDQAMRQWEQKLKQWQENKDKLFQAWELKCNQVEDDWNLECKKIKDDWLLQNNRLQAEYTERCEELLRPSHLEVWRKQQVEKKAYVELDISNAAEGRFDDALYQALKGFFPDLDIRRQQGLCFKNGEGMYTPDVIVHDPKTGIWIDVEVDEPWWNDQGTRKSRHCSGDDDRRNNFFLENHWIVIRFAESQVATSLGSCLKEIGLLIDHIRRNNDLEERFENAPMLPRVPQWSCDEALQISRRFVEKPNTKRVTS